MGTESKPTPKWKIALIPILGIVLLIVLIPGAEATTETAKNTTTTVKEKLSSADSDLPELAKLPTGSLESALKYDPFEMRTPLLRLTMGEKKEAGPTQAELAAQLAKEKAEADRKLKQLALMEKIQQLKVTLVIETERGMAAIINDKKVFVGDEIQPNVLVTHIDHNGLRVKVKNAEIEATGKASESTTPAAE